MSAILRRPTFHLGLLIAAGALAAGCTLGLAQPTDEMNHAAAQQRVIVHAVNDPSLDSEEREAAIREAYASLMEQWRPSRHYGRFSTSDGFHQTVGVTYYTVGSYFDGRNERAKALPFWQDGAEEARAAALVDDYLLFQGNVVEGYLHTGRIDRARFALHELDRTLRDLLLRGDREALFESGDPYQRFYYLMLEDYSLRLALAADEAADTARWRTAYERRGEILEDEPRVRFMHLRRTGARFGGSGTSLLTIRMDGSNRNPNWQPLYNIARALAPDPTHHDVVEAIITELHEDFDHMEGRIHEDQRMFTSAEVDAAVRSSREGVRSGYWRHATEAALRLEMGQHERAHAAVARATEAYEAVAGLYARVPEHLALREGVRTEEFELVLLQARIDEETGAFDRAWQGYGAFVEWSERSRDALPSEQRQHFFESVARAGYLGRLRASSQQYGEDPSDEIMARVLDASEQFRSRQLMELLETETTGIDSLADVREALGPGGALLMLGDVDTHLVAATVSGREHGLTLIDKPDDWDEGIFTVRNRLAQERRFEIGDLRERLGPLLSGIQRPLEEADALYVVADGALSTVPASVLPLPDGTLLQQGRPLRYLPSLSLLVSTPPATAAAPSRDLFAVGDPIYDRDTVIRERLGDDLVATTRGHPDLGMFTPLPETRDEVQAIAARLRASTLLLGEEARESVVKARDLSAYRFLHFATHGVLDGEIPDLTEPALVLSYEDDEDGLLMASEISELRFNAELAVLSACNTGTGEYFRGEGLMGLGRAFMVAGSRQVLVSMWPVDSFATKELMIHFYDALADGHDAASALAHAQTVLMEADPAVVAGETRGLQRITRDDERFSGYRNPFYWSPFILVGAR